MRIMIKFVGVLVANRFRRACDGISANAGAVVLLTRT